MIRARVLIDAGPMVAILSASDSLMRIAAREGIDRIFTLDRRDFAIYRLPGRRALRILPEV